MTRRHVSYNDRQPLVGTYEAPDVDQPLPGYYRSKLRSGAALCGVRIWFGPPHDPMTGEVMDRSHRMQAEVNGRYIEIGEVWPKCAGEPITKSEYEHYCAVQTWAEKHAPSSPQANPKRRVNPLDSPLLF